MAQQRPSQGSPHLAWLLFGYEILGILTFIGVIWQFWGNPGALFASISTVIVALAGLIATTVAIGDHPRHFQSALKKLGNMHRAPLTFSIGVIRKTWEKQRVFLLGALCVLLLGVLLIRSVPWFSPSGGSTATPVPQPLTFSQQTPDGETIGISEGGMAFDVASRDGTDALGHRDGALKQEAADAYREANYLLARQYWNQAVDIHPATGNPDSDDAEANIYREDLNIKEYGYAYVTLIIAVPLTGIPAAYNVGRDDLQAAYVEQHEFNKQHSNGLHMRLLIANIGTGAIGAPVIAERIKQSQQGASVQRDDTLAGVVGWPLQTQTNLSDQALQVMCSISLPIITLSTSEQGNCGNSVVPTAASEAQTAANYAVNILHAKKVGLIFDPANTYSNAIAAAFEKAFLNATGPQGHIVGSFPYTLGVVDPLPSVIQSLLKGEPDLIYFAGYPGDLADSSGGSMSVLTMLALMHSSVKIMGTSLYYQDIHYPGSVDARVAFTTFAWPTESAFEQDYAQQFDPSNLHPGTYGYNRTDADSIVTYEATGAFGAAIDQLLKQNASVLPSAGKQVFSPGQLNSVLNSQNWSWQGLNGQITFAQLEQRVIVIAIRANKTHYEVSTTP
ncbi:MAG TPA: ABC transporter substrate-binding protein [Ktedonobacteraceae bacterium]|nr:ABC transporter substrate-binding protein [Ktedonobacteraceae bacterium]